MEPVVALTRELIARPSVTPDDAGCQDLLAERLRTLGFVIERMPCGDVSNLWARRGTAGPLLCFAGHTDVVPTGPVERWTYPPFDGHLADGVLYGRGAADMKGSIAAMVCALERVVGDQFGDKGSIALLITSDEEGPARDGTRHVIDVLSARNEHLDWCLIGEPSSGRRCGDRVRVGRRGSLSARLRVHGKQGHVAYPELARNPVHLAAPALSRLVAESWDDGGGAFPPTSLQISNIVAGTGATNVIPGELTVDFNLRFSTALTVDAIQQRVNEILSSVELEYTLDWHLSGNPFLSSPGALLEAVNASVADVNGLVPEASTGGGTSDGRFIASTGAEIVELGPVNATIHQIDECVAVRELLELETVYAGIVQRLFG